jgi:hypothetical protein
MKRTVKRGQVVGFIVTPGEIENRIAALDKSVQALKVDVDRTPPTSLDAGWRFEWEAFLRRWAVERDSYATWDSRLFATRVIPRLEEFQAGYNFWARDFARKSGRVVTVPVARPSEGMADAVIPSQVWWILAGAAALYVLANSKAKL